ncbi:MAG: hypothetical protein Q9M39_00070 [Sulfurovum sp.]|nr:hypothetical protein [Sulfurovum sp.]
MYIVQIENECKCFKKSEYSNNKTFETQQDAYQYANILAELMNDEFCSTHTFSAHRAQDSNFVITVAMNVDKIIPDYNPHISCDEGCDSTDTWTLEDINKD